MTTLKRTMIAVTLLLLTGLTANVNAQTTEEKLEVYELISDN